MRRHVRFFLTAGLLTLAAAPVLAEPGNVEAGEDVFKKCRACHDAGPDAKNKVGPQLTGVVGRKVGSAPDYTYSDANKAFGDKGAIWTEDELFKYLANPLAYMPKTKMAFAGLSDEQDRRDVIAYLAQFK